MDSASEIKKVFILVRTYPTPAKKGVEVSCTAGITDKGEWIRIFPVPWRLLAKEKKFHKYQWIEVEVVKSKSDPRKESHKIRQENIKIQDSSLEGKSAWRERRKVVGPLMAKSLCSLSRERDMHKFPTLGIFKPKSIDKLSIVRESNPDWTSDQLAALRQGMLFDKTPMQELEKIPYKFIYSFHCSDASCKGHELSCSDWEMAQAFRSWREKYRADWEAPFRQKFESEMINHFDTHFCVGTIHKHPNRWIIISLFYPPYETERNEDQQLLFGG